MRGRPFIPAQDGKEIQMRCDTCGNVLTMDKEELRAFLDSDKLELIVPRKEHD